MIISIVYNSKNSENYGFNLGWVVGPPFFFSGDKLNITITSKGFLLWTIKE